MVINPPNVKVMDVSGSACCLSSREAGVTLIEMMIVIAIAAILLATAAPSFQTMVVKSNVEALQDDFANAVITARTEAASRGQEVRVCALGSNDCSSKDWSSGWMLVIDDDTVAPPIRVLARFPNEGSYPVTVHNESGVSESKIAFNAQGYNDSEKRYIFAACGPDETAPKVVKGVTVEFSGRAYHTSGNSNKHDGKLEGVTDSITLKCTQA